MIPDNCPLKSELNVPVKCPCYNKNNCNILYMQKYYKQKEIIKNSLEEWQKITRKYNDVDENAV